MDFQEIGKRIQRNRKSARLTQEQLAERADMSATYISRVERGNKKVSLSALSRIADALQIPVACLLDTGSGDMMSLIHPEVKELLETCSETEQQIIFEVAKTLRNCLRAV